MSTSQNSSWSGEARTTSSALTLHNRIVSYDRHSSKAASVLQGSTKASSPIFAAIQARLFMTAQQCLGSAQLGTCMCRQRLTSRFCQYSGLFWDPLELQASMLDPMLRRIRAGRSREMMAQKLQSSRLSSCKEPQVSRLTTLDKAARNASSDTNRPDQMQGSFIP